MNVFFTHFRRRVVLFGLLAVLLAAVVAFQSISLSSLVAVWKQINAVSGQYTTIAVPKDGRPWALLLDENDDGKSIPLMQQKTTYPGLLSEDRRGILNAHVTDCFSVSCYERGVLSNEAYDMYSRSLTVLAVRCSAVFEDEYQHDNTVYGEDGSIKDTETVRERYYSAEFTLEETVRQFPSYDTDFPPIEVVSLAGPYPSDGNLPFEEGKTYLLFGCLFPGGKYSTSYDADGNPITEFSQPERRRIVIAQPVTSGDPNEAWEQLTRNEFHGFLRSWRTVQGADGVCYKRMDEGTLPFCAEYDGSVEDFLKSSEGKIWRDTILPLCQINYESANVILTDNLSSVLWFNTGDASIFEGRSFEPTEYADGEDVCIISAAYALKNDLSVGDSIEMDFYSSDISTIPILSGASMSSVECNIFEPCKEENRLGIKKTYHIIGVYSAPEFAAGKQVFSANTIFIPKASIPDASDYEDIRHCLLYSLILENGKASEFEAIVKARGCAGSFAYFDQDYNVLAETLDVMEGNAVRMMLISGALFVLVAALFFFLFLRQTADPARKLRLLGVRAGAVRRQRCGAAAILILVAAVLGAAGGAGLYDAVTKRVLSGNIALQPVTLLLAVAGQTTILLIAALICTLATARQNLMQKK